MLEITLRTSAALECMRAIRAEVPEAIVGAGTVCNARDVDACLEAGARFAVSPGYTAQLGLACRDRGLPLLPGVSTASEIMQAQQDGYTDLKFFPAMQAGGVAMLKALYGPFAHIQFCPTGGITAQNAGEFLALPNVICVGGSWLVPAEALAQGDYKRIEALARQAAQLAS
jgi:2-dehydro-3-deoxyphosphogluconate aldolase/(4S)-4-hydroxy-2-oxoglutarate aldolase